jgi:primosomal protein N' (replication factor Y)
MKSSNYRLTAAQRIAVEKINATIDSGGFAPFLLHGVTGSGKTEVYLRAVRRALALDRSSIIVVPEIGLAQAMYYRLEEEFASEVALLHSRLTQRSRLLLWEEIRAGQRRIVLGPRSSVFASVPRLGLIVVDEEHDQSLKQESPAPRYHARDVALYRARLEKCAVVLGSATPALESYHNALAGKYQLLQLPERVDKRPLPRVSVVNLRQEREAGRYDYLSEELLTEMKAALNQGGQVMLLLNRRGFSPSVHCHGCGERILCRHCAVTLVYHKRENVLLCHSCGYRQPYPRTCSACGGGLFLFRGIGTEKLTEVVSSHFPEVEVARMDLDTTRRKGSFAEVFDSFRNGRARILIGTQMIAKGFDFPDVALMGVISADTALELPDFRARERTFQLLTQAAGRAGRHSFMGRVLLQTLHPEDATIKLAVEHDYQSFYESEIVDREAVGFPPFRRLLLIALEGTDPVALQRAADWVASGLKSVKNKQFQVLGPVPAPVAMRRGRWRFQILIKTSRVKATLRSVNEIVQHKSLPGRTKLSIIVDVDPMTML